MTLELIILRGLPASGKTTFANDLMAKYPDKYVRTFFDSTIVDLNWKYMKILKLLAEEKNIILDDYNMDDDEVAKIKLVATEFGRTKGIVVEVNEVNFFDIPLSRCIRQDMLRDNPVGKSAIEEMASAWLENI